MMFRKILLPLNGSVLSGHALEPALKLAPTNGGQLTILTIPEYRDLIITEPGHEGVSYKFESEQKTREAFASYQESICTAWGRAGLTIRTRLLDGDPASLIIDTAIAEESALIVMATHGYSGLRRWRLGSVTEKVLEAAPCPVLAVRSAEPIQHLLLTLDGSTIAEQAVEPAIKVARQLHARVTMLIVRAAAYQDERTLALLAAAGGSAHYDPEDEYHRYLEELRGQLSQPGPEVCLEVARGPVAETILDYAKARQADLIAMATHGRSGLRRWIYGSVTAKVLREAECGMLVVRPPADLLH
ncbi:MAG: universal stress protein [Anaerolineales bacterium]|nr:universal stress protein [Anaerolineales bacterium]